MHIIFDLDGTLIDSYPGIEKAFYACIQKLNCQIQNNFNLKTQIGRPLYDIFYQATNNEGISHAAIPIFRQDYGLHYLSEFNLYQKVEETLQLFTAQGHQLHIVTNKAAIFAKQMIEKAGLSSYFISINGPAINQSINKSELIQQLFLQFPAIQSNNCIMVGDTKNDYEAVFEYKIPVYIMLHGYGKKSDFEPQEITCFCSDFCELANVISQQYAGL